MDAGKATVFIYSQMSNSFTLNTNDLDQFIQKKKIAHFKDIYATGRGYGGRGYIVRR